MEKLQDIERTLDAKLAAIPAFEQAERQTGIRKTHLVVMAGALCLSFPLTLVFPGLLTFVLTLAYPLFATARAADGHDKSEDVQWLAYWLVYGLSVLFFDVLCGGLVRRFLAPIILVPFRIALLVFMYAPQTKGASLMWQQALRPALHVIVATCPGLQRSQSGRSGPSKAALEKKRVEVAKALNEMRNRGSGSRSGDERDD